MQIRITGHRLVDKAIVVSTLVAVVAALTSGLIIVGGNLSQLSPATLGSAAFITSFIVVAAVAMAYDHFASGNWMRFWKQALVGAFGGAVAYGYLIGGFGVTAISFGNIAGLLTGIVGGALGIWLGYEAVERTIGAE